MKCSYLRKGVIGKGFVLILFAGFFLVNCKNDTEPLPQIAKITPVENVDPNSRADSAYNAYNTAFLVKSNGLTFYKTSLNNSDHDYFWQQALDIQMTQDTYLRTKNLTQRQLINALLTTFNVQGSTNGSGDWTWNGFNDDLLWATLIYLRGYQITGNIDFLNQAKYGFNLTYYHTESGKWGWDDKSGGIWWRKEMDLKSPLSNSPAVIAACYLYEFTNDKDYLNKAISIYNWTRMSLYNENTGEVWGEVFPDGRINKAACVFNNGAFAAAANYLHRLTGEDKYYDDALRTFNRVKTNMTWSGILAANTRTGTDLAEYIRYLGDFVRENNLWSTYYPWMKKCADAAWKTRRIDLDLTWNDWVHQTPIDSITTAMECSSAVVMQQVTPTKNPGFIDNGVYCFVSKTDSASALSVVDAGTNNGAIVNIQNWKGMTNQGFKIVLIGRGYYRLIPIHAPSKSLTVTNSGSSDGTTLEISDTQSSPAQYWNVIYDYDGFFKLKPKCAPSYCLNVSSSKGLPKCILRKENNSDNERWLLRKSAL